MDRIKIHTLLLLIPLMVFSCSPAQETDFEVSQQEVTLYIDSLEKYTSIVDTSKANDILNPYYDKVISYMSQNDMEPDEYYLTESSVKVLASLKGITVPLKHYDAFKEDLILKKANAKRKMQVVISGSLSEKSGTLIIDSTANETVRFLRWQ